MCMCVFECLHIWMVLWVIDVTIAGAMSLLVRPEGWLAC